VRIVTLQKEHLEEAGLLVSARYRLLRQDLSLLPACYEQPQVWSSMLEGIASARPGVAALRGSKFAGFLAGWQISRLRGRRAVYAPEWGNGVVSACQRRRVRGAVTRGRQVSSNAGV
jgi:hypothetical protein